MRTDVSSRILVHLIQIVHRPSLSQKLLHATGQTNTLTYYPLFWDYYLPGLRIWFMEPCVYLPSLCETTFRKISCCP